MGTSALGGLVPGNASISQHLTPFQPKPTDSPAQQSPPTQPPADQVNLQSAGNLVSPLTDTLRELAARVLAAFTGAENGPPDTAPAGTAQSEQLAFDFFAEVRATQLVVFHQQVAQTAQGIQDAPRRDSLVEVSQQVAARFEFSLSVSASVLTGFSSGANQLGDTPDLDDFLELTQELLAKLTEILNGFFGELSDIFAIGEDLQGFIDELNSIFAGFGQAAAGSGAQSVSVQLEFSFTVSIEVSVEGSVQESDPIVLDLDGDGIELTHFRDGARFDIQASGRQVQTAFVTGGDAFLAIDRNGNGLIDDGSELFGDQRGAANGFEELRSFDTNGDGQIDRFDANFDALRLFRDNGNGQTEAGELITLAEAGIESISVDYFNVRESVSGGNRIEQVASFRRSDGTEGRVADAILNFLA